MSVAALIAIAGRQAIAQPMKIGRTVGRGGSYSFYVAIDKGFLKAEGLDANFIAATAGVLVRATTTLHLETLTSFTREVRRLLKIPRPLKYRNNEDKEVMS